MTPRVDQFFGVEMADGGGDFREFQETRARWNQQTDRQLDRRNRFDQIILSDGFDKIEITFASGPWSKRNECGLQREARIAAEFKRAKKISACVALFQFEQNLIVQGLDSAGHEDTTSAYERWQSV